MAELEEGTGAGTGAEAEVGVRAVAGCKRETEWERVGDAAVEIGRAHV